ncbi:hypothetical protein [Labilibaculum sp.]|uniref:hypothetical protein n=1 Tax=Labilibaculum sp. TaxID=2060723 RepID=UPI002AA62C4C|nr:hypothetical protein [Labilibaculum sp.]
MTSQREVERLYEKLMHDVATKEFYTDIDLANKVNCYVCEECQHITKTKDVDPGVTPFMFTCEVCKATATSTFYTDIAQDCKPTIEWYRPSLKETLKLRKDQGTLDHVLRGGLIDRKCKEAKTSEKQLVFVLELNDTKAIYLDLDCLCDALKMEWESRPDSDIIEEEFKVYGKMMTAKEIDELPEFDGF